MTLDAGTKLGAYEIAGLLGAGGMGEVYKATDTRLNRSVAIKVLPSQFSERPDLGQEEVVAKVPSATTGAVSGWDEKHILFFTVNPSTGADIGIVPLTAGSKLEWVVQTNSVEAEPSLSPDGRWLAYFSNETGRLEVYVQPFPPNGQRWPISTTSGRQPLWRRDGKELFYVTEDAKLYGVEIRTTPSFEVGVPKFLFEMRANVFAVRNSYWPSADGQRFLVNMLVDENAMAESTVVLNWTEALKK